MKSTPEARFELSNSVVRISSSLCTTSRASLSCRQVSSQLSGVSGSVDSQRTLTLQLGNRSLTDAFVSLVSEVADKSDESAAMSVFLETLADRQQLLLAHDERLSEEALRGLIAELWFGFELRRLGPVGRGRSRLEGPWGGEQDYNFPSPPKQFEVKSIRPGQEVRGDLAPRGAARS